MTRGEGGTYDFVQRRRRLDVTDVVEQVTVRAELADDHHWNILRVLWNAHADLHQSIRANPEYRDRKERTKRTIFG